MDGRTYRVPSTESYELFHWWPIDGKYYPTGNTTEYTVWTDLFVPNGTWVTELPVFGCNRIIGIDRNQIQHVSIDNRYGMRRWLCMADQPFGFVTIAPLDRVDHDSLMDPSVGPTILRYARQIHKGELGQGVTIPKLELAREQPGKVPKMHQFPRNRDQRRNHLRWARLNDVVAASGLPAQDLLKQFWTFVDWHPHHKRGQQIDVRFGVDHTAISTQLVAPSSLTYEELDHLIRSGRIDEIWIRSGLANTFLRLIALNYQPAVAPIA